jgi:hypothetical protein
MFTQPAVMLHGGVTCVRDCGPLQIHTFTKEDYMALNAHLETLKRKHQEMSEAVETAQRAPGVDDLEVASMKKEKLRLKEEIARLSS